MPKYGKSPYYQTSREQAYEQWLDELDRMFFGSERANVRSVKGHVLPIINPKATCGRHIDLEA